jgi:antitoxin ParD1/3/4
MPTQNVNLTDHQTAFVHQSVQNGRYQNASEVVRAGLRLLEQRELEDQAKLEHLRLIAREGFDALDRGEGTPLMIDELDGFFGDIDRRVRGQAAAT